MKGSSLRMLLLASVLLLCACIKREPQDPLQELFEAAGITLVGVARVNTDLDLRFQWQLGCETRMGNLVSDAFAARGAADIGIMNGGGIRDDQGLRFIPRGEVTRQQINQTIFFQNRMYLIRMRAFRIKQALEAGLTRLSPIQTATKGQDADPDGPQHGNCFFSNTEGNGRFLHVSSRLRLRVAANNQAQVVTGTAAAKTLQIATPGRRIVAMEFDDSTIYTNAAGDGTVGWLAGPSSCASFTLSAACNFYRVVVSDFIAAGNDGHPTFDPAQLAVSGDGSVQTLSTDLGAIDSQLVFDHLLNLTQQGTPAKPEVQDRLLINAGP